MTTNMLVKEKIKKTLLPSSLTVNKSVYFDSENFLTLTYPHLFLNYPFSLISNSDLFYQLCLHSSPSVISMPEFMVLWYLFHSKFLAKTI